MDPVQAIPYGCLVVLQRVVHSRSDLHANFITAWHATAGRRRESGPISKLRGIIQRMSWSWLSPWTVRNDSGVEFDMRLLSSRQWKHEVREGLRRQQWRLAAGRRQDMRGIEAATQGEGALALECARHLGFQAWNLGQV